MNAASDRRVVFALLIIVGVCLVGLGASLYRAKVATLKDLNRELAADRAKLAEVQAKVKRMPELESEYAQLQSRLSILEPTLPTAAYIPTFLRQIENLARSTNNEIVMIRPKAKAKAAAGKGGGKINNETGEVIKEEPGAAKGADDKAKEPKLPYDFTAIELKINGTYWSTVSFLTALQRFPKMIAVNNVSFQPQTRSVQVIGAPRLATSMDLVAVVSKTAAKGSEGNRVQQAAQGTKGGSNG